MTLYSLTQVADIVRRVTAYAEIQGRELAATGINLNFAPVLDLRPATQPHALDFHSRIATRALASDPATVALAGETYVSVLARHASLPFSSISPASALWRRTPIIFRQAWTFP